jgi:chorismate dehydratase
VLFGKIDYINLLPFYTFSKRYIKNSQFKQSINYKKDFPSAINKKFKQRKIDAAFISSIESKRGDFKRLDIGIIAKKEIKSVLVKKGVYKADSHSATSNLLAKKLGVEGEVIIGDKALKAYIKNPSKYVDLAKVWYSKHKLPFVFARLCVHKNIDYYDRLTKQFVSKKIYIPNYIIKKYSKSRGIDESEIKSYLKLVSYRLDSRSKMGLKRFLG